MVKHQRKPASGPADPQIETAAIRQPDVIHSHHAVIVAQRADLVHPEDADELAEVFDEFFPDVRPPRCVSKIGVDRPGLLVSMAMVAVTD